MWKVWFLLYLGLEPTKKRDRIMKIYYKLFFLVFLGFNLSSVFAVTLAPADQIIQEIIDNEIDGSDMAGMEVSVDGVLVGTWNGTSSSPSDDWKLTYTGTDTKGGYWGFTNTAQTSVNTVMFDAFGANAVFDWEFIFPIEGTENSGAGDFVYSGSADTEFTGPVKTTGSSAPVGDLYRWLTFDFTGVGGLSAGDSFEFIIDSDKFAPVPLPPAVVLLFSGLLGLACLRHSKQG